MKNKYNLNGDVITEDYTNEFGDLVLFPIEDSIFAEETIQVPEVSEKDIEKLENLEQEKKDLELHYNYNSLIKEREAIVAKLTERQQ